MIIFDYIVNLSIYSLLVSTPLVIRSYINHQPLKKLHLWVAVYAGFVSVILVMLSVKQQGFSYDIRYAPIILVFTYLGPVAGLITGAISLLYRLYSNGHWPAAIAGWALIMTVFSILHVYLSLFPPLKRSATLFGAYIILYICTVFSFHILQDQPIFHIQYLLFVMLGVLLGGLLIESNEKLRRIITEKKVIEKTLEASESKYRLIAENTSDLIMVMDKDHSISYFSPSHEFILGYQSLKFEGTTLCEFVHPDDLAMFKDTIQRMLDNMEAHSMEFRLKHKEGHWIEFESRCRPVKGDSGLIEHIVIISRDISERKKAEEFLLQSEKLSIVGEMAAGVAHEIRNPLTTIKGFLQIQKKEKHPIKYSDLLLSELERIETITSELLSLGKPQAVQLTRTDVKELIAYTVEFLSPQVLLRNIEFKVSYEESAFPITCEKNQLKQVFLNILKNAIESMPNGGMIQISLRKEAEDECVILVEDQGCGIPEDHIHRLGQPFYSLKEKGTGLGLMISHKIIKQHHGRISYRSKVNEGTLIEVRIPLIK
ncbi:PAS domain-containing sensor histidine kinase [Paenibacillus pectinilyticus]|uniref:histidine kinase n=1 Tax=Paenibacillus pectinilyticus TaxID=512399 RepID=A0A1C0ZVT5_9BACL|nr:PAS domain-containing sensor histidine kinase [Paenibacillus pectinilyticus]